MDEQTVFNGAAIAQARRELGDPDQYVRSGCLWRIRHAVRDGRAAPEFLAVIFPVVAAMLREEGFDVDAPGCLMQLDREKAIPILLSPECLRIDNPQLEKAIDALNGARVPIPHAVLRTLIEELEPLAGEYPRDHQLGAALVAYGLNPDGDTEECLRLRTASPLSHVAESAAWGLVAMNGLVDVWDEIAELERQGRFSELSAPQKHYFAAGLCDGEVQNGGLEQYLGNSGSDYFEWAVEGLAAIQAPERAKIVEAAGRVFGPGGPPREWDARREMVNDFPDEKRGYLNRLDDAYYAASENLAVLSSLYVVEHAESFRARAK